MQTLSRRRWYVRSQFSISTFEINSIGNQNITAFLMDQNRQFNDAVYGLNYAKESLDPARSEISGPSRRRRC